MWMGLGMIGYVFLLYWGVFPVSQFMRLGERVGSVLPRDIPAGQVVMIDFKEPSLAFYQGGTIRERDDTFLLETPSQEWPKWVVLTDSVWKRLPPEIQNRLERHGSEKGWNYADGGRIVEVLVLRRRD
jgi:hypothetical protein